VTEHREHCAACQDQGYTFEWSNGRTEAVRCHCTPRPRYTWDDADRYGLRNYRNDRDDPGVFRRICSHLAVARRTLGLPIDDADIIVAPVRDREPVPPTDDDWGDQPW